MRKEIREMLLEDSAWEPEVPKQKKKKGKKPVRSSNWELYDIEKRNERKQDEISRD